MDSKSILYMFLMFAIFGLVEFSCVTIFQQQETFLGTIIELEQVDGNCITTVQTTNGFIVTVEMPPHVNAAVGAALVLTRVGGGFEVARLATN